METAHHLKFNEPGNQWEATINYEDGVPVSLGFYFWDVQEEMILSTLQREIGEGFKMDPLDGSQREYFCTISPVTL